MPHTCSYRSGLVLCRVTLGCPALSQMSSLFVLATPCSLGFHTVRTLTRRRYPYRRVWASAISAKWAARMREEKNCRSVMVFCFCAINCLIFL